MNWEDGTPKSTNNDFHFRDGKPSIFAADPLFNKYAQTSILASEAIQRQREQGKDNTTIYGLSPKADAMVYLFRNRSKK